MKTLLLDIYTYIDMYDMWNSVHILYEVLFEKKKKKRFCS